MNIFLSDILSQPRALRQLLNRSDLSGLEPVRKALLAGKFERILLTGMGASLNGLYPAWLKLASAGLPAIWVDSSELLHHAPGLIGGDSLVWAASQSGRSAEVVGLLKILEERAPAGFLAITNDIDSPLGQFALQVDGYLLPLFAEPEESVSTRTYLNTLALGQLASQALTSEQPIRDTLPDLAADLSQTADMLAYYLENYRDHLELIEEIFADRLFPPRLVLLGRGVSMASVLTGALNVQEAAKLPAMGMQTAQFRHGPLEIADENLTAWIFLGCPGAATASFNLRMWTELKSLGVNACLVGQGAEGRDGQNWIALPEVPAAGLPLLEMAPVQLLCCYLADRQGYEPGSFRRIAKVTESE